MIRPHRVHRERNVESRSEEESESRVKKRDERIGGPIGNVCGNDQQAPSAGRAPLDDPDW